MQGNLEKEIIVLTFYYEFWLSRKLHKRSPLDTVSDKLVVMMQYGGHKTIKQLAWVIKTPFMYVKTYFIG